MQNLTTAFRNTFLVTNAYGEPIGVLTQKPGASDDDVKKFMLVHIENGVEVRNFAELIEAELQTPETKNRIAALTKPKTFESREGIDGRRQCPSGPITVQYFTEPDAIVKIVNEIVQRYQNVMRYSVQPRSPQPKEADGERGRRLAAQDQAAFKAATALPPKVEALLEKRRKIDAEIDAILKAERLAKLREEEAKRKAEEEARGVEAADNPKTLAQRYRDFMRRQEAEQKARERA